MFANVTVDADADATPPHSRFGQQNVAGFEIAVDDAVLMGELHGPGQGLHQPGGLLRRLRRAVELTRQRAAVHEFQGEVGKAARLVDFINLHDVGVLQTRHRLGLDAEAREIVRPGMAARQHHLEAPRSVSA